MKYDGRIIDIHTHIQPAAVLADRIPFVENEPDFRIIYKDPASRIAGSGDVLTSMGNIVDAAVILGFAWRNPETLKAHNDEILSAAADNPGRLYGFCCVYPFAPDPSAEVLRCFKAGASGLGEVGLYDRDIDTEYIYAMQPVMRVCREWNRPLMLHVNEPVGHEYSGKAPISIKGIYDFVKAYPDNRIILAHWGGGLFFYNSLKKEVKNLLKNVWYDSAASPYLYDGRIWKLAAELAGIERILFGTDFPLLSAKRYIEELDKAGFSRDELERIYYRNAEDLLGISNA
ncbi:MAG: amidohydrolase [Spirochaetales bacterium]|nr:amidohydrolase [Spirochaetales bacterium]